MLSVTKQVNPNASILSNIIIAMLDTKIKLDLCNLVKSIF